MEAADYLLDAQKLSQTLKDGKKVYQIFLNELQANLVIHNMPIKHWEEKFKILVPTDDLTPTMCKELNLQLLKNHQEVAFFYAEATARLQMFKTGSESVYNKKFNAIVAEYKTQGLKLPAAATLESMAKVANLSVDSAYAQADMEAKFWKNILGSLETCRRLIEQASINVATERKALENDHYNDALVRKANNGGY